MLKKEEARKIAGQVNGQPVDVKWGKLYPVLWDHLTQNHWEDGEERITSNLLIFCDGGVLKAMLRDRNAGLCLWVASASMGGLFECLEASLADPGAEWRVDRQMNGQQAKRTKRTG